jgi:hypothetical protein
MKDLSACTLALLFLFALTASAQEPGASLVGTAPGRRVALVTGNTYDKTRSLTNLVNDAKDMADALRDLNDDSRNASI